MVAPPTGGRLSAGGAHPGLPPGEQIRQPAAREAAAAIGRIQLQPCIEQWQHIRVYEDF